jgi:hypothetical protein
MRRITMTRYGLVAAALALAVSACGTQGAPVRSADSPEDPRTPAAGAPHTTTTGGPEISGTGMDHPPPFRLRYDDQELVLRPHTWCYGNGCVDGFSENPPSVGSPAAIRVQVPVEDWDLVATFTPSDQRCGRHQSIEPVKTDGWYVLHPAGPAGRYDVELFAHGVGDMVGVFQWTTPTDGTLAEPRATLALIAEHDGEPDSYGVELMLENLAATPETATAEITVSAANGRSLTFDATRARPRCWPTGTVFFDGPDAQGRVAAALGDFPFHYEVSLTINGTQHQATADYPADEVDGNEPSVALEFAPPLPALTGER